MEGIEQMFIQPIKSGSWMLCTLATKLSLILTYIICLCLTLTLLEQLNQIFGKQMLGSYFRVGGFLFSSLDGVL